MSQLTGKDIDKHLFNLHLPTDLGPESLYWRYIRFYLHNLIGTDWLGSEYAYLAMYTTQDVVQRHFTDLKLDLINISMPRNIDPAQSARALLDQLKVSQTRDNTLISFILFDTALRLTALEDEEVADELAQELMSPQVMSKISSYPHELLSYCAAAGRPHLFPSDLYERAKEIAEVMALPSPKRASSEQVLNDHLFYHKRERLDAHNAAALRAGVSLSWARHAYPELVWLSSALTSCQSLSDVYYDLPEQAARRQRRRRAVFEDFTQADQSLRSLRAMIEGPFDPIIEEQLDLVLSARSRVVLINRLDLLERLVFAAEWLEEPVADQASALLHEACVAARAHMLDSELDDFLRGRGRLPLGLEACASAVASVSPRPHPYAELLQLMRLRAA